MSVDEMIYKIGCLDQYPFETTNAIIALLKAGQAMRDEYVDDVQSEYGPYTQEELYIRWPEIKAWDAACGKEEEG